MLTETNDFIIIFVIQIRIVLAFVILESQLSSGYLPQDGVTLFQQFCLCRVTCQEMIWSVN